MDAVESLSWGLMVVFALHQRVRPYNKYLAWEVTHHPLGAEGWVAEPWDGARLLALLAETLDTGSADAQRELFALVERDARRAGHGPTIDAWDHELPFIQGSPRLTARADQADARHTRGICLANHEFAWRTRQTPPSHWAERVRRCGW